MKSSLLIILSITIIVTFLCSYFGKLVIDNSDQYLAVIAVAFMDGFFGIIAGTKKEGFKTFKAIKILKTVFTWIVILTVLLMVERGFKGTAWLSETIIVPFIVFQFISTLKNAAQAGFIKNSLLNDVLSRIDKHKNT
jgi:phage-related holin